MNNIELQLEILKQAFGLLWNIDISNCPCNQTLDKKLKNINLKVYRFI